MLETVLAISNNDLIQVGIETLGERVQLREARRHALDTHQPSVSTAPVTKRERFSLFKASSQSLPSFRARRQNNVPKPRT